MSYLYMSDPHPTKIKCKKYMIPIYSVELHVGVGKIKEDCEATTHETESGVYFVVFAEDRKVDMWTIAHETSHVVDHISEHIGETLTGEPRAYLTGYIVRTIDNALKHRKNMLETDKT